MYSFIHCRPQIFIDVRNVFVAAVVGCVRISICLRGLLSWGSHLISQFSVVCGSSENHLSQQPCPLLWAAEGIRCCVEDAWYKQVRINFNAENHILAHINKTDSQSIQGSDLQQSKYFITTPEMVCVCGLGYVPPSSLKPWLSIS